MAKTVTDLARRWLGRKAEGLTDAERRALEGAIHRQAISRDTTSDYPASLGERASDSIARAGGSWTFILSFLAFLVVWTLANVWLLGSDRFDPYPFVFLNLVLSMVAALQAPIIMMAQNRQAARDRIDAAHDYEVNLKAEIEIMALHEKLDELRQKELVLLREEVAALAVEMRRRDDRGHDAS